MKEKKKKTASEIVHEFYNKKPFNRFLFFCFKGGLFYTILSNYKQRTLDEIDIALECLKSIYFIIIYTVLLLLKFLLFPLTIIYNYFIMVKKSREFIREEGNSK